MSRATAAFFNFGAFTYDLLTAQAYWRDQIAGLIPHLGVDGRPMRILDLGCGPGVSAFVLGERLGEAAHITGIDFADRMIERARSNHATQFPHLQSVEFVQADARRLPFPADHFDGATGHSFLYLVSDRDAVLREVFRVLKPGGRLVLMEPSARGSLLRASGAAARSAPAAIRTLWPALRFATSMGLWRLVSAAKGRLSPETADPLFRAAGFRDTEFHPTLAGLGLHCVARKPTAAHS